MNSNVINGWRAWLLAAIAVTLLSCGGGGGVDDTTNTSNTVSGLTQRPANPNCALPNPPSNTTGIQLTRVFSNLSFNEPVALLQAPGNDIRWYVLEQTGVIHTFQTNDTATRVFADLSDRAASGGEMGLLSMAFHPDFQTNGQVFVSYTRSGPVSHISRFVSLDGGITLDIPSQALEDVILTVNQPFANHNGGQIAFGPGPKDSREYLYIGLGDGGNGNDPEDHGQNTSTLLGAMLRIDVDATPEPGLNYAIPPTNPLVGQSGRDEIFAYGLRNPWRWSFDRTTNELWVGDVGQNAIEEIDRVSSGDNLGWRCFEGDSVNSAVPACTPANHRPPVVQYDHGSQGGQSVTGGYLYRGNAMPGLVGTYFYADFVSGRIWTLFDPYGSPADQEQLQSGLNISSFAEDNQAELYVVDHSGGGIYRLDPAPGSGSDFPTRLSDTGCVVPSNPQQAAPGMIPYSINAPFWSDGAVKERFLAIPDAGAISIDANGDWVLPSNSVLLKHFRLNSQLIETRLLVRHANGGWAGYTYEWDDQQTDATLVMGGKTKAISGQTWIIPSGADCLVCHTDAAGRSLGLETAQMNRDQTYPSTGLTANQLSTIETVGLFTNPLVDVPGNLPALSTPSDVNADVHTRARAYLHTNCAQCHRAGGPTNVNIDLHHNTPDNQMNICNAVPQEGDLGAQLLFPGDASMSVIVLRAQRRDNLGMPPLASNQVDVTGVSLLTDWINNMTACP